MSSIIIKTSISEMRIAVARVLPQLIDETADAAMNNIEQDTKRQHHGRMYRSRRSLDEQHQASAPGEGFATDTESLVGGMSKGWAGPLTMEIGFNDVEGKNRWLVLEFGGGRIAPRPLVVPMFEHMQDGFTQDVARGLLEALTEQGL